jgi:hypothetical protein
VAEFLTETMRKPILTMLAGRSNTILDRLRGADRE